MADVSTPEAEGGQALFCYIADILGTQNTDKIFTPYISGSSMKKGAKDFFTESWPNHKNKTIMDIIDDAYSYNRVDTEKSKKIILQYLEKKKDWFVSSLLIGKKVLDIIGDIDHDFTQIQSPGWQSIFYQHGDEEVMGVIKELFKSANNQTKRVSKFLSAGESKSKFVKSYGDINKWTPADIYFASSRAKKNLQKLLDEPETKKDNLTFRKLNKTISDLIKSGDLLPLSLKKVKNNVVIKKVNFSPAAERKLLEIIECTGIQTPWHKMQSSHKMVKKKFVWPKPYSGGRDIYITFNEGAKKCRIQIRHTPTAKGKPQKGVKIILQYIGSSALAGQIVGMDNLTDLISTSDLAFATTLKNSWDKNYKKFEIDANNYINFGNGKRYYNSKKKELRDMFNDDIGAISGKVLMNPVRTVIADYFKTPKEVQHNVIRTMFQYAASRSLTSARYVIAKD